VLVHNNVFVVFSIQWELIKRVTGMDDFILNFFYLDPVFGQFTFYILYKSFYFLELY